MAREHELETLAKTLAAERSADAEKLVPMVFGASPLPDSEPLNEGQFAEYVRSGWQVPEFRKSLLKRYGAKRFKALSQRAFGLPETAAAEGIPGVSDGRVG